MTLIDAPSFDQDAAVDPPALTVVPSMAVSYAEIRMWAVWLNTFTPSDLADAMGVDLSVGYRGVKALLWHGICEDTGDTLDGSDGPEPIIGYVPLPPGPREHETGVPPEILAVIETGGFLLYDPRGVTQRIRSERDMRRILSTSGAAAVHRRREAEYQRQERAREEAAQAARLKAQRIAQQGGPKWALEKRKRVKRIGAAIERGQRKAQERNAIKENMT